MSLSLERAQRILDENCAEWVREIGLSVVRIDKRGATLKLPRSPRWERVGGTISGQAVMALIDTAMIIAICGHQASLSQ
jgi:acyl-coenzyme A thioesterase PaaI-like protein